jgi:hypothetical protein
MLLLLYLLKELTLTLLLLLLLPYALTACDMLAKEEAALLYTSEMWLSK